jgi:hypothetical protein
MSTWNETTFDPNASAEEKALEFDLQIAENGGDPKAQPEAEGNWNPYNNQENRRG